MCYNINMRINYLGHSAVLIIGSKNIIIDPFITGNPKASLQLEELPKIDFVLVTHDHPDHFGDAIAIAKRDQATLIAIFEISEKPEVVESKINVVGMNIGGTYRQDGIVVSMTEAIHSATVGSPTGLVVEMDGKRIYHAGDTSYWSDIGLIPKLFGELDVAFLPIGGHYTMDIRQAVLAVNDLKPKLTIPIHYNTWPVISADGNIFKEFCLPFLVKVMLPGETEDLGV